MYNDLAAILVEINISSVQKYRKPSKPSIFFIQKYICIIYKSDINHLFFFRTILLRVFLFGVTFKIWKGLLTWNRRRWLRIERNRSIALLPHKGLHSVQYETIHRVSLLFDRLHRAFVLWADGFLAACWASRPS